MPGRTRAFARAAVSAGLVLAGLTALPTAADAATVKVCVNKRSGKATALTGRKCPKGWKKVSWRTAGGKAGKPGPAGSSGPIGAVQLYANGVYVGPVLGQLAEIIAPSVLIDGGIYTYLPNGKLYGTFSPKYRDAACQGTPFATTSSLTELETFGLLQNSTYRLVNRPDTPASAPVRGVWRLTGTTSPLAPGGENLYSLDDAGVCVGPNLTDGIQVDLTAVPPPPDLTPPLTFR